MSETVGKQWVIVGLGNPGKEYELTRHNIGYLVVQALARQLGTTFREEKQFYAYVAKGRIEETTFHLLLPTTYMNLNGQAIRAYLDFYKLGGQRVCVVCDDVALEFGQMRLRASGSAGGHNGLKSIEAALQTMNYVRLRMGIGLEHKQERSLADYVLDAFMPAELQALPSFIEQGAEVLKRVTQEELSAVMNAVNIRKT